MNIQTPLGEIKILMLKGEKGDTGERGEEYDDTELRSAVTSNTTKLAMLEEDIADNTANIATNTSAIASEVTAREAADSALQSSVNSLAGAILYGTCSTASDTLVKQVTCEGFKLDSTHKVITIHFDEMDTTKAPILNINGTGDLPIYKDGEPLNVIANPLQWYPDEELSFGYYGGGGTSHYVYLGTTGKQHEEDIKELFSEVESIPQIQHGSFQAQSVTANGYKDYTVTFPVTFAKTPTVVAIFGGSSTAAAMGNCSIGLLSASTTGATIRIWNNDSTARTPTVHWIAVADN